MLQIRGLTVRFPGAGAPAVDDVTFSLQAGEIMGLVGESGSGKTMTARAIMGLLPRGAETAGEILFRGKDLLRLPPQALRRVRGSEIGMVFQEPLSAMDPLMKVGKQVEEALGNAPGQDRAQRRARALEALALAELPDPAAVYDAYPHMLSGGMRQRAMIAAAIVSRPSLLLLDEPTTALDVTVQAQILALLKKLNREQGAAMLFISHDLRVVRKLCAKVAVMQKGRLVERGDAERVFTAPEHEYTKALIAAGGARTGET